MPVGYGDWKDRIRLIFGQPLCGWAWLEKHEFDYTQADIHNLSITIGVNGKSVLVFKDG